MKIDVHLYLHEPSPELEKVHRQLVRLESLMRRIVDEDGDRATAKELTGAVQASTQELKDAMAATPTPP